MSRGNHSNYSSGNGRYAIKRKIGKTRIANDASISQDITQLQGSEREYVI